MKIPKLGSIASIAAIAGIGYVAYKFIKGDWKIPDILGGAIAALPGEPEVTIKETGVPGAIGDVIYNLIQAPDLRERVEERAQDPAIPFPKAVAEVVSEDIHEQGLGLALVKAPVTIGAGFGAIWQQAQYLKSLPEKERIVAERTESEKRLEFRGTPEGAAATAIGTIFPPLALFTAASAAIDMVRVSAPKPKPPIKAAPPPIQQQLEAVVRTATPPTAEVMSILAPKLPAGSAMQKFLLSRM